MLGATIGWFSYDDLYKKSLDHSIFIWVYYKLSILKVQDYKIYIKMCYKFESQVERYEMFLEKWQDKSEVV